jgi:hypothetical protein
MAGNRIKSCVRRLQNQRSWRGSDEARSARGRPKSGHCRVKVSTMTRWILLPTQRLWCAMYKPESASSPRNVGQTKIFPLPNIMCRYRNPGVLLRFPGSLIGGPEPSAQNLPKGALVESTLGTSGHAGGFSEKFWWSSWYMLPCHLWRCMIS